MAVPGAGEGEGSRAAQNFLFCRNHYKDLSELVS